MNRWNTTSAKLKLAKSWLAGLLAALLFLLTVHSGGHASHADQHHSCAACLIAHGGVIADGAVGAVVFVSNAAFDLPQVGEVLPASVLDLRLAPGRAPPV